MVLAVIGMGTNLGDKLNNLRQAVAILQEIGSLKDCSGLYESDPWGYEEQPMYFNAVARVETELSAHQLLAQLKECEQRIGRNATFHWGPREIDLDILSFGDEIIDEAPELVIPHPQIHARAFVLIPWAELDSNLQADAEALPDNLKRTVRLVSGPGWWY